MSLRGGVSGWALVALAASTGIAQAADPLNLLVSHDVTVVGADGVTRTTRFAERVYRRDGLVWMERVVPERIHQPKPSEGKPHKHIDTSTAARWIEQGETLRMRLVNAEERMIIDVQPAEYGNIGFDGNWTSVYHLIDPAVLAKLRRTDRAATPGSRWYEGRVNGRQLRILWDEAARYPRRVESSEDNGRASSVMIASTAPAPKTLPWRATRGFREKEYSDLLD